MSEDERSPKTVTATEVAAWVYCPESFRLSALGHKAENRPHREDGIRHHRRMAMVESETRFASSRAERGSGCASVVILLVTTLATVAGMVM